MPLTVPAVDVSEKITVKNTFLDVCIPESATSTRRCSSVPRSWMPGVFRSGSCCGNSVGGDESTAASDKESVSPASDIDSCSVSDKDAPPGARTPTDSDFECIECDTESIYNGSGGSTTADEPPTKPTIEVKLFDFVGDMPPVKSTEPARTKLRSAARPFMSATRTPPAGIQMVLAGAKDALQSDPGVIGVQVMEGGVGSPWTMVAHTRAPSRNPRYLLAAVKKALLASAEHSRDTYILGYDVKPFTKIDKCSFTTTLASIPDSQQNNACWDTYKSGYCPRRITCRWCHPGENEVLHLVIRVQRELFQPQEDQNEE